MHNSQQISKTPENMGTSSDHWYAKLQCAWSELQTFPRFGELATMQRGIAVPSGKASEEALSAKAGKKISDLEPYIVKYSNTQPLEVQLAESAPSQPKVIVKLRAVDAQSESTASKFVAPRWPLVAAIDDQGLPCPRDCALLWPTEALPVEVLAALLNSPLVNAYLSIHQVAHDNFLSLLQQVPIPRFDAWQLHQIGTLVRGYRAVREEWRNQGTPGSRLERASWGLFERIESELLGCYRLSMQAERDLIAYFAGEKRPGPISSPKIKPSPQNRLYSSSMRIEDIKDKGGDRIVDAIVMNWNPYQTIHFPLSLVPKEFRDQIAQGTRLFAKINIEAKEARNLVFEDIKLPPELKHYGRLA